MSSARPTAASTLAALKPCRICDGESCIVIPSIASAQHLCLIHYYTTGAHRSSNNASSTAGIATSKRKKSSSLLLDNQRINSQLPNAQELFAEAFIELQKEIGEESARAFQSAASAEDPLALLLDSTAAPASSQSAIARSFRRQSSGRKRNNNTSDGKKLTKQKGNSNDIHMEGGFIRETVFPEKIRKLQQPNQLEGYASKYNQRSTDMSRSRKRPVSASASNTTAEKAPPNPYQRKQNPPTNVWNQVLDSNNNTNSSHANTKKKTKLKWEDMEKEMINNITSGSNASSKTCSCGSTNVEIDGSVTSRNNDMMKGEVWGMKNRAEVVVERCHCLACGKTWNEE